MKASKTILLLLFLIPSLCLAQDETNKAFFKKNSVYVEILGEGMLYSLNYERIVSNNGKFNTSVKIGGNYLGDNLFFIPMGVSEIIGRKNHHLETGLGLSASFFSESISEGYLWLTGRLGYRYQKPSGNFLFKAMYTPIIVASNVDGGLIWFGISVGYAF